MIDRLGDYLEHLHANVNLYGKIRKHEGGQLFNAYGSAYPVLAFDNLTFTGVTYSLEKMLEHRTYDYVKLFIFCIYKDGLLHGEEIPAKCAFITRINKYEQSNYQEYNQTLDYNGKIYYTHWYNKGRALIRFDEWLCENGIKVGSFTDEDRELIKMKWEI